MPTLRRQPHQKKTPFWLLYLFSVPRPAEKRPSSFLGAYYVHAKKGPSSLPPQHCIVSWPCTLKRCAHSEKAFFLVILFYWHQLEGLEFRPAHVQAGGMAAAALYCILAPQSGKGSLSSFCGAWWLHATCWDGLFLSGGSSYWCQLAGIRTHARPCTSWWQGQPKHLFCAESFGGGSRWIMLAIMMFGGGLIGWK